MKPKTILFEAIFLVISYFAFGQTHWTDYPIWENTTKYNKTYVVNQKHIVACDTNAGTEKAPLKTIKEALSRVKPGEKIIIHRGVYLEKIEPITGGISPANMIAIEAAEGEHVIIKGAKKITCDWVKELSIKRNETPPSITKSHSQKLWITTLHDTIFTNNYFPFSINNLANNEQSKLSADVSVNTIAALNLKRGMIFQEDKRLVQLHNYGDLIHVPGSFWVDTDGKTIHLHPFDNKNPNELNLEVAVTDYLLKPKKYGVNYIQVKGLLFEKCANGFAQGEGAVNTLGGHHWIFENNTVREINGNGLECGYEINANLLGKDKIPVSDNIGYINVRHNYIYSCGISAIWSKGTNNAIIKENDLFYCGWHEAEMMGESAGIKCTNCANSFIAQNRIHHNIGGAGIWLWGNCRGSRISKNVIYDVGSIRGAIVIEDAKEANLIDNNFIYRINGIGLNGTNSSSQLYYQNLVAYTTDAIVKIATTKRTSADTSRQTAKQNCIKNNLFVDFAERMNLTAFTNDVAHNVFVFNSSIKDVKLKYWQRIIVSKRGLIMKADVDFNPDNLMFKWSSTMEMQPVPPLSEVETDIVNDERGVSTIPGPFATLPKNYDYYISLIDK